MDVAVDIAVSVAKIVHKPSSLKFPVVGKGRWSAKQDNGAFLLLGYVAGQKVPAARPCSGQSVVAGRPAVAAACYYTAFY